MGKPEGNRPLAGPKHRWENDIKETGWEGVNCINLAQDRDKWRAGSNAVKNVRVP